MGNLKSRSSSVVPINKKQQSNTVNVIQCSSNKTKCKECGVSGYEFDTISRDGTSITKMYHCRNCSNYWNA